jgi:hypothetical protein
MLSHTEQVHANAEPYAEQGRRSVPARGMPAPEPGPVATERASEAGFEVEPQPERDVGTFQRGPTEAGEDGAERSPKQGPALGTLIALAVIIIIIILNIIGGGSPE